MTWLPTVTLRPLAHTCCRCYHSCSPTNCRRSLAMRHPASPRRRCCGQWRRHEVRSALRPLAQTRRRDLSHQGSSVRHLQRRLTVRSRRRGRRRRRPNRMQIRVLFMRLTYSIGSDMLASPGPRSAVVATSSSAKPSWPEIFRGARKGRHLTAALGALVVMCADGWGLCREEPDTLSLGAAGPRRVPANSLATRSSTMSRTGRCTP